MLPYCLLLLISAVFPFVIYQKRGVITASGYIHLTQKRNKMTIVLFFVGLFILLALRDITVGKDLKEYRYIFELSYRVSFKELTGYRWELGYTTYNKIVSIISKDYRFFLIFTAIIILIPIYKLYSKEKKYSFLLIVLFINMPCFLMIFSGLRQAIAISIGVLTFMAIENKKYILSALLIILATYFHVSSLILILLYPAFLLKIKANHLIYIVPIMIGVYIFRVPMFSMLIGLMPSHYSEFYGEMQQTGAFGMMILLLMFSAFSFVVLDETVMSNKDFTLRNILLIATVSQFFVPINGLVQRMSYYFLIFVPIALLSVVQAPKKVLKNISDIAVIVMSSFFLLYFVYNGLFSTDNLLDVFPYRFFWSGQG